MVKSIEEIIDVALNELEGKWKDWQAMPENCNEIIGPENSGVYQVRNIITKEPILFGNGVNCQKRMKSLYTGNGRNNKDKVNQVKGNWQDLEYRTMETNCKEEAEAVEGLLKSKKNHRFKT